MNQSLAWRMAFRNLKVLKHLAVPFVLSCSLFLALEYIMISLIGNEYVQHRHEILVMIMTIGSILGALLSIIFILYANSFYQKQRRQEFGLYSVLGLEPKHIRAILLKEKLIQCVCIILLSVLGGHLFGSLMFMALNKLMKDSGVTLMDYPFSLLASNITIGLIVVIFTFIHLLSLWTLRKSTPISLIRSKEVGEREPKSRWIVSLIGLASLLAGYYIALTTEGVMNSMKNIFIAIILIMLGLYCLFTSFSIIFLKWMRKRRSYYEKPTHFLSISGMLYRMNSNAISLASISILLTGAIFTLGLTMSVWRGMFHSVESIMPREYSIEIESDSTSNWQDNMEKIKQVKEEVSKELKPEDDGIISMLLVPIVRDQHHLLSIVDKDGNNNPKANLSTLNYILALDLQSFNFIHHSDFTLKDNEVLLYGTSPKMFTDKIDIAGQEKQVKRLDKSYSSSFISIDHYFIVVPSLEDLVRMGNYYLEKSYDQTTVSTVSPNFSYIFNSKEPSQKIKQHFDKYTPKVELNQRKDLLLSIYTLNGGLLFLGLIVGSILLVGTGLMLYYKQLSEGTEDRERFKIMKQVGLPDSLTKQTIRQQNFWIFVLPIIVACLNIAVTSKIAMQLLVLLGITDRNMILQCFILVTLALVVGYGLFYILTSKVYYHLIEQSN